MDSEQEEILEKIISDLGYFLEFNQPSIPDSRLRPYSKGVVYSALEWKEQQLCDKANSYSAQGHLVELEPATKYLNAAQSVKMAVALFAPIDKEDQDLVDYFNSYAELRDVPKDELMDCFNYRSKYSKIALREYGVE